ncbi:transposase [uncultured Ornithinimicrobium sp.]|uniref:transposase n=1 Tax=uncultured Ornithinimicrobium sp. TaxID=259307 RepID=UPI00338E13AF
MRAGAENLTDKQRGRIERAFAAHAEHEKVDLTWQCAQQLRAAYKQVDKAEGRKIAERIVDSFRSCPIPEVARLGRTLRTWKEAFLAYFDTGATNGGTEAIIIWIPPQAVLHVTDGLPSARRRHVIWSLPSTVPTDLPWSWLAFRLAICTVGPRQRHVSDADPPLQRSCPPGAPDNAERPHRATPPHRPRPHELPELPPAHAPHRRRPEPMTPPSKTKSQQWGWPALTLTSGPPPQW